MKEDARPKVLFAIGDADWKYTRGKFHRVVRRVAAGGRFAVGVISHDPEICGAFAADGIESHCLPGEPLPLIPEHSLAMTDLMIRLTRDVVFPESNLPVWKVMAMDDYLGCLEVVSHPAPPERADLLVCPLMGVDNNSMRASRLYSALLLQARRKRWPVVGLEVSLLGNKQTLAASLADSYALKSDFAKSFVLREELAPPERTFVLPPEESYLLTCRADPYWDDFFGQEEAIRRKFDAPRGNVVILIPHHVAFVHEIRRLLAALRSLPFPFTVILRADPNIARQGLREREIASRVYRDEVGSLPRVIVDDQGGWLWPLLLSDVVLAPAHSVFTELAASYGKFTAVCQGWGERVWVNDHLLVEPIPSLAMRAVRSWVEKKVLTRRSLGEVLTETLGAGAASRENGVSHGA
ncbi:MAG TPA: hypothetical protein VNN77_10360 [candidate division Zixibacteria bacterium]|nr:hypothetical protein [candidate division Zixibacteria bacterium]